MKRGLLPAKVNRVEHTEHNQGITDHQFEDLEVGISVIDIWVANIFGFGINRDQDRLVIPLMIQDEVMTVLLDSGSSYNLIDQNTANALGIKSTKLPDPALLRSLKGGRLQIFAKADVACSFHDIKRTSRFFISKWSLPSIIL